MILQDNTHDAIYGYTHSAISARAWSEDNPVDPKESRLIGASLDLEIVIDPGNRIGTVYSDPLFSFPDFDGSSTSPVSYTHLDVYKRQVDILYSRYLVEWISFRVDIL